MRALTMAALAAMLTATPALAADKLDLKSVTCKDFLGAGKDNIAVIITWLDAYYLDKDAPAVIDFDRMAKMGKDLGAYCGANGDTSLGKAAEKVMGN